MRDGPGRRLLTSGRPEVELDSKVSGVSTNLKVSPTAYDRRFAHSHDPVSTTLVAPTPRSALALLALRLTTPKSFLDEGDGSSPKPFLGLEPQQHR